MDYKSSRFHDGRSGSALAIKIIPESNANGLIEISDDGTLIISLMSSQTGGAANSLLIKLLELMIAVPENRIEVIAGEDSDEKLVSVLDIDPNDLHNRIMNFWHNA